MNEEEEKKEGTTPESEEAQTDQSQAKGGEDNPGTQQQDGEGGPEDWGTDNSSGSTETDEGVTTDQSQSQGASNYMKTVGQPALATPSYLADWQSGITVGDAAVNSDKTYLELIRDRERWARETGGSPMDIFEFMPMQGYDLGKSAAENEKARKKVERQQKWEQVGNVLAHLGNFVGALAGAPAQQIESAVTLTERQRKIRDATLQQHTAYNQNMWQNVLKQRADERAAQVAKQQAAFQQHKMEQDERKTALAEKREDRMEAQMWLNEAFRDRRMNLEEAKQKALEAYRQGLLSQGAARIAISRLNSGGYTPEVTDTKETPAGTVKTTKTTVKTPNGGQQGGGRSLGIGIGGQ